MNTHPNHRCLFGILFAAALAMDRGFAQEGGYQPVPIDDEQVVEAAAFAVAAQQEAMKEAGDGKGPDPRLRLLEVHRAHRQLVSGFNFRLDLRGSAGRSGGPRRWSTGTSMTNST